MLPFAPHVVLACVARFAHLGQLVFVLWINAFEHRRVLHHIWHDDESYLAPAYVHVRYDSLLSILHGAVAGLRSGGAPGHTFGHTVAQRRAWRGALDSSSAPLASGSSNCPRPRTARLGTARRSWSLPAKRAGAQLSKGAGGKSHMFEQAQVRGLRCSCFRGSVTWRTC